MFSIAPVLESAALRARERSGQIAAAAARATARADGHGAERSMAASAQAALFSEALLTALKARLGELKAVAK